MPGRQILIEAFAEEAAELADQAAAVTALADNDRQWLAEARPITSKNFRDVDTTMAAMRRVIEARTLDGYVFRDVDTRGALAVGTVVTGMCAYDPSRRWPATLRGDQIDEFTAPDVDSEEHIAITGMLLSQAKTPLVLAFLTDGERERAEGIERLMQPVGGPARIRVPFWAVRGYGLRALREPVQVYALRRTVRESGHHTG